MCSQTGVERPIRFMLGRIPELFAGHQEAMTIIYVQGSADRAQSEALDAELKRLLAAACTGYLR